MKSRHQSWFNWATGFVLACFVFLSWPELDMWLAHQFHEGQGVFPADRWRAVQTVYVWAPRIGWLLTFLALTVLCVRIMHPAWIARSLWRKCLAWVLVVVFGVGLLVHEGLKNQVGRPRPIQTDTMGGYAPFVPALHVSRYCDRNCSFVSGHAAISFCLLALGMWSAPATRRRWWMLSAMVGASIGLVRIVQGGHFLSDVVFSMLFIWGTSLLIRQIWLHWRHSRLRLESARQKTILI